MWYYRDGSEVGAKTAIFDIKKDSATVMDMSNCIRCGGLGGSKAWDYTGFTCYRCGGSGKGQPKEVKVYKQDKLAKLIVAAKKRAEKKLEKERLAAAALRAEIEARREVFEEANVELLNTMKQYKDRSEFLNSLLDSILDRCNITEKQMAAIQNTLTTLIATEERLKTATHVGVVGERVVLEVKMNRLLYSGTSSFGYGSQNFYIMSYLDMDGNTLIYKGSNPPTPDGMSFDACIDAGVVMKFKATIKEHDEYIPKNGGVPEPQTVFQRPSKVTADIEVMYEI